MLFFSPWSRFPGRTKAASSFCILVWRWCDSNYPPTLVHFSFTTHPQAFSITLFSFTLSLGVINVSVSGSGRSLRRIHGHVRSHATQARGYKLISLKRTENNKDTAVLAALTQIAFLSPLAEMRPWTVYPCSALGATFTQTWAVSETPSFVMDEKLLCLQSFIRKL